MSASTQHNESVDVQRLLDVAPCGFVAFDDRGTISYTNSTFVDLLGYREDDVIGSTFPSFLTVGDRIFYQTHLFPMVRLHGRADEIFVTLQSADGTEIPILSNVLRVERAGAFLNCAVLLPVRRRREYEAELLEARDRAEEALRNNEAMKEAQKTLRLRTRELDRRLSLLKQRNSELQRLSRVFAHDLREPVRKMATFADVLVQEDQERLSEIGKQAVEKISASALRMNELMNRLQQYLSLDSDLQVLTSVDLGVLIRRAKQTAGLDGEDVILTVDDTKFPVLEGYESQLELLFVQLFDNALKFRKAGATLEVAIDCTVIQNNSYRSVEGKYHYADFARISISDNGLGFAPRFEEYVFEVLKKIDPDTPGLGMGLAICKKVVANHYGDIEVISVPDAGTTVTVVLPLKHEQEE